MLLEELDEERNAIINPYPFYSKLEEFPNTAVSKFGNVNFGQFFYATANLDAETYDSRSLTRSEVVH